MTYGSLSDGEEHCLNFGFSFTSNQGYLSLNLIFETGEQARKVMDPPEDAVSDRKFLPSNARSGFVLAAKWYLVSETVDQLE